MLELIKRRLSINVSTEARMLGAVLEETQAGE